MAGSPLYDDFGVPVLGPVGALAAAQIELEACLLAEERDTLHLPRLLDALACLSLQAADVCLPSLHLLLPSASADPHL